MQFSVPSDHPCLPGHFPGRALVPGVVLLEHVLVAIEAQAGAALDTLRLPQVKFVHPLLPGQVAEVTLEGGHPHWRFRVHHAQRLLASGEIIAAQPAA